MSKQLSCLPREKVDLKFIERGLAEQGYNLIAGVDEAGRGCLAGPVVAAGVILPNDLIIEGLDDSKKLTPKKRDYFYEIIMEKAHSCEWCAIDSDEIDRINILAASLKAMSIAVSKLCRKPDYLLVDGPFGIDANIPQRALKKGDARSQSIAAASVIAKVTRDRMMCEYKKVYPEFSFDIHKGYGTELHLNELKKHGPTPIHRSTFRGVSKI